MIKEKKLTPPKPLVSTKQVATMLDNAECTEEQIKRLYEDLDECDPEVYENRTVQGWSFVQRIAPNPAGN